MKRFSEQLHNQSKSVTLQAIEREELRNRVLSYMEYHPLPVSTEKVEVKRTFLHNDTYQLVRIPFSSLGKWSAVFVAIVLVVVPFMAEKSVPGDSLYAVKVRFNEEVISTLTLNPYGKVEWETERLNRRIAEARLLASEGKLTDEVEVEMAEAVKVHTENVEREIEALRVDDVDQATLASIELNTTLQMQSESLQEEGGAVIAMAMAEASSENPAQKLVDVINESLTKQGSHVDPSTLPAYEKIMARVEVNTTRAYELLNALELNSEEKLYQDVSRRLEDVDRSIQRANGMREESEETAREQLLEALQRTQKIIVFMSDTVNGTPDIDAVVPIIFTDEEYKQQLIVLNANVERKIEIITVLNSQLSADVSAKALYAVEIARSNQAIIASSTEPGNGVRLAKESVAVLDDTLKLMEAEGVNIAGDTPSAPIDTPATTTIEAEAATEALPEQPE